MRVRAAHEVDRESSDERESFDWFSATDCQKAARAAKIKGLAEAARAMATDAEEFFAALLVDESFGCVLHFPKEAT